MALTVLVTGCDRGVGASLASQWADRGARVFAGVLDHPSQGRETRPSGGSLERIRLDLGSESNVAEAVATLGRLTPHLDVLVNNGAILGDITSTLNDSLNFDDMARVYNVNVLGTLRVTQGLLPLLLTGKSRLVVNISSEAGSIGACTRSHWFAYAMSKAALNQQSHLVHNHLKAFGGRVLVLHPGHVRTFMRGEEDTSGALSADESAQKILQNVDTFGAVGSEHPEFRGPEGETLPW